VRRRWGWACVRAGDVDTSSRPLLNCLSDRPHAQTKPLPQSTLGCNWRAQLALARAFPTFPALFAPDTIHDHWVPIALGLVSSGPQAVKPAAAAGLTAFLRAARRDRPRTELYCRCVRELARGRGAWARLGFLEVAAAALRRFSSRFFKEYLLDVTVELLADPVPNVRLVAATLLPALKQSIRLPEDVEQLVGWSGWFWGCWVGCSDRF
jgi:serine/threonine-protein phosphatase 4 regulatory subunit 4